MVVVTESQLKRWMLEHPAIMSQLRNWYTAVNSASWKSFTDLKATFPTADYIGNDRFCFDLGGGRNSYRLVVLVHFKVRTVYLRWLGTHAAYDKLNAKDELRFV